MSLLRLSGGCSTKEEKPTEDGSKEENISHLRSPDKAASNVALTFYNQKAIAYT